MLTFTLPFPAVLVLTACLTYAHVHFFRSELRHRVYPQQPSMFKQQYVTVSDTDSFGMAAAITEEES